MLALLAAISLPLLFRLAAAATEFEETCLAFNPEGLIPNATRTALQYVSAGTTLSFPDNDVSCNRASQFAYVNLCRVALRIDTSEKSNITFEAWLPETWTGRFLATGNGGIDGCIKYEDIAYGSLNGFATVGANNGKNGTGGLPFLNNAETVIDFAWRSLHTSVTSGKTLTKEFYEKPHNKSYYLGCSLGGRQGIGSAERFPEDFDGIVAGAPGVDFNNLISWRASFFTITGAADSPDFISTTAWKTWIHDEVMKQCDTIDRFQDGIIEDPTLCKFDPTTLLCGQINTTNCLSQTQVEKVKKIFSDYKYPNGTLIYSGMQPGSEKNAIDRLYAGKPFPYSEDWFKYVVYSDPNWNASKFSYDDARAAEAFNPANIRTFPSTLPAFKSRGGKLLMFHGQQDQQITSFNTNRFYDNLLAHAANTSDLESWARYFKIAGMNHCSGGPGAWVIGQGGGAASSGIPFERTKNVLRAVVDWVEQGYPPTRIEGTKFVNDSVAAGVDFTRRHCRYPLHGFYAGGDWRSVNAWNCR